MGLMNQDYIDAIESRLGKESFEVEFSVGDDDTTLFFKLPEVEPLAGDDVTLVEMIFGAALSHDYYSVDLIYFSKHDFTAILFNSQMASGSMELIGLIHGVEVSAAAVRSALIRWTTVQSFKWPAEYNLMEPDLLSKAVLDELLAISDL
jgi:hypothetical protein